MANNIKTDQLKGGIGINNAGIVLLNSYIPMLFERLGLTANKSFLNNESQLDAVHYLQYVVTGRDHSEESLLSLHKVLCGLSLSTLLKDGIDITPEREELVNGLIKSVMDHWPASGSTSVDGFRGNWLVRDGMLTETEDRWELIVEKRAYDMLIQRSPFSFSIIKYPWMDKPLYVKWPY